MKFAMLALSSALAMGVANSAAAHMEAVDLFDFDQQSGYGPWSSVVANSHGTLFGTNTGGGNGPCDAEAGCGTIYALTPPKRSGQSWSLNVLYNFQNNGDGWFPEAPVTLGPKGSLFGYPAAGSNGIVFQLVPGNGSWTYHVLYTFTNGKDGNLLYVMAPLVWKGKALYGIASGGSNACGSLGCGSVFRLTPPQSGNGQWTEKTLFSFTGQDTGEPSSIASSGSGKSLYVSTDYGRGAVVEIAPGHGGWTETVLTSFNGGNDGSKPAHLVVAADGTIYGTAGHEVFLLTNANGTWTRTNIAAVSYHGYGPVSLALGANGKLIGVTEGDVDFYPGNVFQLTPSNGAWSLKQLWSFNHGPDRNPVGVTTGLGGNLYGVLNGGDSSNGSVFELK